MFDRTRSTSTAVLGAPALLALYGAIRLLPGSRQPGAGWLLGHTALFAALLLFGVLFAGLRRLVADRGLRRSALVAAGVAYAGLAASLGQVGIDLYVGATSFDRAAMDHAFQRIQAHPGVLPLCYTAVPLCFYLGLLALLSLLAFGRSRSLPVWSPLLVLVATATMADLDLMSLGAALYLLALAPLLRPRLAPAPAAA